MWHGPSRRPGARFNRGRIASAIAAVPATPLTIFGANAILWTRADLGITIGTGVSAWADQSGLGNNFAQGTDTAQPSYTAADATLNNMPSLTFDGVNDALLNTTVNLGALPVTVLLIAKVNTWVSNTMIASADSVASCCGIYQNGVTPQIRMLNNTIVNINSLTVGNWGRFQANFTNSVSDSLKIVSNTMSGGNAGALTGTGYRLGRQGGIGTLYSAISVAEVVLLNATPSAGQMTSFDSYVTSRYGAGLV